MDAKPFQITRQCSWPLLVAVALLVGCNQRGGPTAKQTEPPKPVTFEIDPTPPPDPAPAGMVWVPGGKYRRGSEYAAFTDARPIRVIEIDGFWMDETPVTNKQ